LPGITIGGNINLGAASGTLGAGQVAYTGGATVDSLKPAQVGADVTGSNTAANTTYVGSRAASEIVSTVLSGGGIDFASGLHQNKAGYQNSNISIGANGALSGAGGGQVSLGGLGAGALATLNQITAANASTYIGAGAITTGLIASNYVYAGTITAGQITSGTLDASVVNVANLNASNITSGTLTAAKIYFTDGFCLNTLEPAEAGSNVTAQHVLKSSASPSSDANLTGSDASITGFGWSAEATASSADRYTITGVVDMYVNGSSTATVTVTVKSDGTTQASRTFTCPGATGGASWSLPLAFSFNGLSAGSHTIQFYARYSGGSPTTLKATSFAICERVF
jgi:hypothetical protein